MRARDFIIEGGWDTVATQGTVVTPNVVKSALAVIQHFVSEFNGFLKAKNLPPVEMGRPTGSSAYHNVDAADKVYGDIDLQMIAQPIEGLTYGQFTTYWNKLADEFVKTMQPDYVHNVESKPGHPIVKIADNAFVQVDFMWHEEKLRDWGATRVTPERGIKGLLQGNMYSVFGELLDMSIQHAGVQLKTINGEQVPFSKQKGVTVTTVTTNPKTWIYDTFMYLAKQNKIARPKIDPALKQFAGSDIDNVKIANLVQGVKAFAKSAQANGMFGQGALASYSSADNFVNKFWQRYEEKAMADVNAKKRDKASTPDAIARADSDRQKVLSGLETVKSYFAG